MPFHVLDPLGDPNDDRLVFLDTVAKGAEGSDYSFRLGLPMKDEWPKNAKIFMSKEYKGVRLASHIGNLGGMIVASKELREAIEKHCPRVEIEYLPFTLMDHRKRPYSDEYCVVNPLGSFDCADKKASVIVYNSNGKVSRVNKLALDARKVAKAPQLFRVDLKPSIYVLGPALSDELRARKLTNVVLRELEGA
jgi:hypothetical protein